MTLPGMLERHAEERPDKTAVIYHHIKITYRELNRLVNKLASSLVSSGLNKGDRVGVMLPRTPELLITFLAVAKARGIAAPINFEMPVESVRDVINNITPDFVITGRKSMELALAAAEDSKTSIILTEGVSTRCMSWHDMLYKGDPENPDHDIDNNDVFYLNYTSGSTGNPKGAVTTYEHVKWNTLASIEALKLGPDDIHLCMFAPFAHPHEIFARPLYLGGTTVLVETVYPKSIAQAVSEHKVTCMMGLAPMYENLLDMLKHKAYDLSSLRIPESGGMFTRMDLIDRFKQKLGVPIIPVWGSTETTGIALANRPGEDMAPGSAGKPCPYYEVKIVDEDGSEVACGEVGELIFKGPAVLNSYFEDSAAAETCFRDGWYYSGDLGKMDASGNYYFVERKTGMMKVAGLKVYPLEIEQALLDHPLIKEAAVIPFRDRLRGEVPRAIIVTADGETLSKEEVIAFCKEKLSRYKIPRSIKITESLPKIGSGKINKKALQLEYI